MELVPLAASKRDGASQSWRIAVSEATTNNPSPTCWGRGMSTRSIPTTPTRGMDAEPTIHPFANGAKIGRVESPRLPPKLLSDWPLPRPRDWMKTVNQAQSDAEMTALRRSVQRGTPFGSSQWQVRTGKPSRSQMDHSATRKTTQGLGRRIRAASPFSPPLSLPLRPLSLPRWRCG